MVSTLILAREAHLAPADLYSLTSNFTPPVFANEAAGGVFPNQTNNQPDTQEVNYERTSCV